MKKVIFIFLILVLIIPSVVYFYSKSSQGNLEYHTCYFDKETLNINCSEELRILLVPKQIINCTSPCLNYSDGQCTKRGPTIIDTDCNYKPEIYSNFSMANLKNIDMIYLDKYFNESLIFSDVPQYISKRVISVKDVGINKTFSFFLKESGLYDVEKNKGYLDFSIDFCKTGGNSELCMPEDYWRCGQGWESNDGCFDVINIIDTENLSSSVCYKLEYENPIAYCLAKIDINECFEYAKNHPKSKRMCDTIKCQEESKVEYEPGEFAPTDKCTETYHYGTSPEDCNTYYNYEDFKKICESNIYYYNTSEKCRAEFDINKQRCIDYHNNKTIAYQQTF